MSDGIGGIGAVGVAQRGPHEEETGIDLRPTTPHAPLEDRDELIERAAADARAATAAVDAAFAALCQRLDALEAGLGQLQGQHTQVEMSLPQYAQAINTLNARQEALGRQVARNLRLAALDAATKSGGPGLSAAGVLKNAEMFLAWLEPPAPDKPAKASGVLL